MKNDCQANSAMQSAHIRVAKELGAESLVEHCYAENGTGYEKAVHDLLVFTKAFTVTVIDDGKRPKCTGLACSTRKDGSPYRMQERHEGPSAYQQGRCVDRGSKSRRLLTRTCGASHWVSLRTSKLEGRRFNRSDADRERGIRRSCVAAPAKEPDARRVYGLDNNAWGFRA
jgi:hypothetical protein